MTEVMGRDGTWTFDGEIVRLVPGRGRGVHKLRQALGELAVPLEGIAGIAYEPAGRKGGVLRLRLREGADPLLQAAGGALDDAADPYQLAIENDRTGVAEFFAEDVRNYLVVERIPSGPVGRYLLPGPGVPISVTAGDGTGHFDGERIRLEWNWMSESSKQSAGPRTIWLRDVERVELTPSRGLDSGHLRFRIKGAPEAPPPKHDTAALMLWGFKKEGAAAILMAAAVVARLPHPFADSADRALATTRHAIENGPAVETRRPGPDAVQAEPARGDAGEDADALLRRLRELGKLYEEGILTDEEFAAAKQAIIRRF